MPVPEGHASTCALSATSIKVLLYIAVYCNRQLGDVNLDKSSSVSEKCYHVSLVE